MPAFVSRESCMVQIVHENEGMHWVQYCINGDVRTLNAIGLRVNGITELSVRSDLIPMIPVFDGTNFTMQQTGITNSISTGGLPIEYSNTLGQEATRPHTCVVNIELPPGEYLEENSKTYAIFSVPEGQSPDSGIVFDFASLVMGLGM